MAAAAATPELVPPQRIVLRFRTVNSPSDEEITKVFFKHFGFTSDQCYFHWQPREYEHTHVIVDVHCGIDSISDFQCLPHQVYRMYKRDGDEAVQLVDMGSKTANWARDSTRIYRWCL